MSGDRVTDHENAARLLATPHEWLAYQFLSIYGTPSRLRLDPSLETLSRHLAAARELLPKLVDAGLKEPHDSLVSYIQRAEGRK